MFGRLFLHRGSAWPTAILRDRRGTSLIEFGVAAPILLIFVAGVSDLGRGWSDRYSLQQVVNRSLEMAQAGRDGDYNYLKVEAEAAAGAGATATVEQWIECGGSIRAWDDPCANNVARFVKLTVRRGFRPLFGTVGFSNAQSDGTVLLTAHATLRVS